VSVRLFFFAVLVSVPLLVGCTTTREQRRESMREQSEIESLDLEVTRLKSRVEALEAAQNNVYGRMEDVQRSAAAERGDITRRLAELERGIKALDDARERDRQLVIDALTKKITGLMQARKPPPAQRQSGYEHVVQPGETLSEIAAAYNVSVNAVVKANNLKDPDSLRVGQTLFVPE
jgi:predicted RNase H-like nuclease (RuvC/YqgF family)